MVLIKVFIWKPILPLGHLFCQGPHMQYCVLCRGIFTGRSFQLWEVGISALLRHVLVLSSCSSHSKGISPFRRWIARVACIFIAQALQMAASTAKVPYNRKIRQVSLPCGNLFHAKQLASSSMLPLFCFKRSVTRWIDVLFFKWCTFVHIVGLPGTSTTLAFLTCNLWSELTSALTLEQTPVLSKRSAL